MYSLTLNQPVYNNKKKNRTMLPVIASFASLGVIISVITLCLYEEKAHQQEKVCVTTSSNHKHQSVMIYCYESVIIVSNFQIIAIGLSSSQSSIETKKRRFIINRTPPKSLYVIERGGAHSLKSKYSHTKSIPTHYTKKSLFKLTEHPQKIHNLHFIPI